MEKYNKSVMREAEENRKKELKTKEDTPTLPLFQPPLLSIYKP